MRSRPGFGRPLFVSQRSISATVANNRAPQNATEAAIAAMIALMVWWDDRDVGAVCRKGPTPELRALEPVPFLRPRPSMLPWQDRRRRHLIATATLRDFGDERLTVTLDGNASRPSHGHGLERGTACARARAAWNAEPERWQAPDGSPALPMRRWLAWWSLQEPMVHQRERAATRQDRSLPIDRESVAHSRPSAPAM